MHAQGILDTSALIEMQWLDDPKVLPDEPLITTVTLAEIAAGSALARDEQTRSDREAHLRETESEFDPIPFDAAAARAFEGVVASLVSVGRQLDRRKFDAFIAATALANSLPVYTCNPDDFAHIDGLEVVVVPHSS